MTGSFLELLAHQLRPAVLSKPRVTQPLIRDVLSLKPLIVLYSLQCSQNRGVTLEGVQARALNTASGHLSAPSIHHPRIIMIMIVTIQLIMILR